MLARATIRTQVDAPAQVRAMRLEPLETDSPTQERTVNSDADRGPTRDQDRPATEESADGYAATVKQSLRYAEDLVTVYAEEKKKRKALEEVNQKLSAEVEARRCAEQGLKEAQCELERKVQDRTRELSLANASLQNEIVKRQLTEEQIRSSLREKEVLLSEIHHRVKNNLQIVSSLLGLQCDRLTDETSVAAFADSQSRIRSMALIHEQLYRCGNLAQIHFGTYIEELARTLIQTGGYEHRAIRVRVEADDISLGIGAAVPCALMLNELLTNCLKHAFDPDAGGTIEVGFHRAGGSEPEYRLTVADNGRGLPRDFGDRATKSLGLQLVRRLAEIQLKGRLELQSNGGTSIDVVFRDRQ